MIEFVRTCLRCCCTWIDPNTIPNMIARTPSISAMLAQSASVILASLHECPAPSCGRSADKSNKEDPASTLSQAKCAWRPDERPAPGTWCGQRLIVSGEKYEKVCRVGGGERTGSSRCRHTAPLRTGLIGATPNRRHSTRRCHRAHPCVLPICRYRSGTRA